MKLTKYKKYTILAFVILAVSSCEKEYQSIEELDETSIQAYIEKNNLSVQKYSNGVYYEILEAGAGEPLAYNKQYPIFFTMRSLNGKYIAVDTFTNRYVGYLGYLAPEGLRIGVKELLQKSRGQIRLIIPSRLAFGRNGSGKIPGNESFDISVKVLDKAALPAYEDATIQQYMQSNSLTGFTKTSTGIYYKIIDPGTGSPIIPEHTLKFEYTGKLFNGTTFDSSTSATLVLADLIKAWKETIPMLKEGGKIKLLVPSSMAYGLEGPTVIPPFSCLDFDVKVIEVI